MLFNATFNNISVISWWPVLLVEKTTDLSQVTDKPETLSHNVVLSTPSRERGSNSQFSGKKVKLLYVNWLLNIYFLNSVTLLPSPLIRGYGV